MLGRGDPAREALGELSGLADADALALQVLVDPIEAHEPRTVQARVARAARTQYVKPCATRIQYVKPCMARTQHMQLCAARRPFRVLPAAAQLAWVLLQTPM